MGAVGILQDERGFRTLYFYVGPYFAIPSCGTTGRLGLKWLSLAYQEQPIHNWYQLVLYFIPVKPGKMCILNMAQRQ
jgi:hypothetical protein